MNPQEELKELGLMLTATSITDTNRIESIQNRISELSSDQVDIIHKDCGKRVEDCDCVNPEVSAV